jgi:hypothetical protein
MNLIKHHKRNLITDLQKKQYFNKSTKVIGDFTLDEKLGEGTFSKVRLGHHVTTMEKVNIFLMIGCN